MTSRMLSAVTAAAVLPACVVVHEHDRPVAQPPAATATPAPAAPPATAQPAFQDPPSPPPVVEQPHGIAEGRPPGLRPGAPEAYWVWHDGAGWHVRTTTARLEHRFQGRVWALHGQVGAVHPTRLEWNDRFRHHGNEMTFDFHTMGNEDGFDFQIAEGDCAQFHLFIDGRAEPERVFVGASDAHPTGPAFRTCGK